MPEPSEMFKTVLRPNICYQFRCRERKNPIRNNYGPNPSRCSITLATYFATDLECSWCCIYASFQGCFWVSVCTASCANSQRCYHSSTAIAVGMPYFMGCISVQYFLFALLHKQNVNHVVRTRQKITCSYQCSSSGKKSILICRKALTLLT